MSGKRIRALVTNAGSGSTGNVIRALRRLTRGLHIVGINDDRFTLRQSSADRNYLCPAPDAKSFIHSVLEVVRRERVNVIVPTDDNFVKAFSDARTAISASIAASRRETIDLCQDKFTLKANSFVPRAIRVPRTYAVRSLRGLDGIFARFPRGKLALVPRTPRGPVAGRQRLS